MKYKLKRIFTNIEIENLMLYIVIGMGICFMGDLMSEGLISSYLSFDRSLILEGQVWRIVTFLIVSPTNSVVWIIFSLMYYYFIGSSVEKTMGSHEFTMYFLTCYIMLLVIGFTTGVAVADPLYFSLLLVFAAMEPHYTFRIYFLIPIEVKWLALIDALLLIIDAAKLFPLYAYPQLRILAIGQQLCTAAAFAVYFIFFGRNYIESFKNKKRHKEFLDSINGKSSKITVTKGGKNKDNREK